MAREAQAVELEAASRAARGSLRARRDAPRKRPATDRAALSTPPARPLRGRGRGDARAPRTSSTSSRRPAKSSASTPETLEPPADASDEGLAALETEAAELAASIERLGPVNLLAFEEHKRDVRAPRRS